MMAHSELLITLICDGPTEATRQQVLPTDGFRSLAQQQVLILAKKL